MSFCWLGVAMAQTALDPNRYVNVQIAGDTLANGTHNPAKTVYTAQPGQIYAFDGTLFVNFPLVIQGSNSTWLYNQTTPPIFLQVPGAGTTSRYFINLRAGGSITVRNILFSAFMGDGNYLLAMIENAAGDTVIVDNCVFTDHDSHALKITGAAKKVYVTNCLFMNGIRNRFNQSGGMPIRIDGAVPDILLENNTSVNMAREFGNGGEKFTSNLIELHYTYLNMQTTGHELHWYTGLQANNIYYNWCWTGRKLTTNGYETYFTCWQTHLNVKAKLDSISLYNGFNLFYLDPKFTNYWKNNMPSDSVYQCLLWNRDVDSTIRADNNFKIGKNYWQFDPKFTTPPNNTDSMLAWVKGFRGPTQPTNAPNWRITPPITYVNGNPILKWPPPFNLTYTNDTLMKAGTDGLPLGDLNWFPDKKAMYMTNRTKYIAALKDSMLNAKYVYIPGDSASALITSKNITGIESNSPNIPKQYYLSDNYPNPFNPTTAVSFQLSAISFVTLKVHDVLGREVATLLNEMRPAGSFTIQWDGSSSPTGVYFYTLQARPVSGGQPGDFRSTKKMVLLK
jgi:hypothetical protein